MSTTPSSLLGQVASADVKAAQKEKADADEAKAADDEKEWNEQHATDIAAQKAQIDVDYSSYFSSEQRALILRAETLRAESLASSGDDDGLILRHRDAFFNTLQSHNLCQVGEALNGKPWQPCDGKFPETYHNNIGPFTPAETALTAEADSLNDKCRGGDGEQTEAMCNRRDALMGKMKAQGICWGPEGAIEADKHWMRCL